MIERTSSDLSAEPMTAPPPRTAFASDTAGRPPCLDHVARAYLIGVGGVGMSGVAGLLAAANIEILGSDRNVPLAARNAVALGLPCAVSPDDEPLPDGIDLVVYSSAIPEHHPQRAAARARGIPQWRFAEMLGALMDHLSRNVAAVDDALADSRAAVIRPEAMFLVWIDCRAAGLSDDTLRASLAAVGLIVEPGIGFGEDGSGFVRLNIATTRARVIDAAGRLRSVVG